MNDVETVERLVSEAHDFAMIVARSATRGARIVADRDELVGAGMEGLVQAARAYSTTSGVPFRYYAARRVRGAIVDELRRRDPLTRSDRARVRRGELEAPVAPASIDVVGETCWLRVDVTTSKKDDRLSPAMLRALASLPAKQRRAVTLTLVRGLTLREAGDVIGLSESGVCRARSAALRRLRALLGEEVTRSTTTA